MRSCKRVFAIAMGCQPTHDSWHCTVVLDACQPTHLVFNAFCQAPGPCAVVLVRVQVLWCCTWVEDVDVFLHHDLQSTQSEQKWWRERKKARAKRQRKRKRDSGRARARDRDRDRKKDRQTETHTETEKEKRDGDYQVCADPGPCDHTSDASLSSA